MDKKPNIEWVTFNSDTQTYDTPDGTAITVEIIDRAEGTMLDLLYICILRDRQRSSLLLSRNEV